MKDLFVLLGILASIPNTFARSHARRQDTDIVGAFYIAAYPNGLNNPGNNLTAQDNNITLSTDGSGQLFIGDTSNGSLNVLGIGEGYSQVYICADDGSVHYTNPGEQPPAGSLTSPWSFSTEEADTTRSEVAFTGQTFESCTDTGTGVQSLRAASSNVDPGCSSVQIVTTPG